MPPNNILSSGPTPSSVPAPPIPNNPQVQQGPPPRGNAIGNAFMGNPQAPPVPPTTETLIDIAHKTGYINSMLRELLAKPNISSRDVINGVGHLVSEQIMDVPMAAKYLSDLPPGNDQIRQWLTQHFVASSANLKNVAQMLQTRATPQQGMMPPQGGPPQGMPPPNMMQQQPPNGQ